MLSLNTTRRSNRQFAVNLTKRRSWYTDPPAGNEPPAGDPAPAKTPPVDPKLEPKFTQAELDAIAGNTRKEASTAARKALLKELGLDPEDPKAVELIKGKLTAAQQAEDAQKTSEQKALERIALLEQERDAALARETAAEAKRKTTLLDGKLETLASRAGGQFPVDVIEYARRTHADEVKALVNDADVFDDKKAQALIETIKKERPNFFDSRRGAGTGSHGGGERYSGNLDKEAAYKQLDRQAKRGI